MVEPGVRATWPSDLDEGARRRLYAVGLGVVGSATVLGGMLYLIRRQLAQGDVVKVTLVHELDPATRALAERWLPPVQKMAEQGLEHRVRLFARGSGSEAPDILGALAPKSLRAAPNTDHLF